MEQHNANAQGRAQHANSNLLVQQLFHLKVKLVDLGGFDDVLLDHGSQAFGDGLAISSEGVLLIGLGSTSGLVEAGATAGWDSCVWEAFYGWVDLAMRAFVYADRFFE